MAKRIDKRTPSADAKLNSEFLTAGQNETTEGAASLMEDSATTPEGVADQFRKHRAASVKEEVSSDVVLHQGIAAFSDDPESLQKLLNAMVGAKVLSRAEALAGLRGKNSTMSMLRKIAEHADVILHPEILPFLQPGYSVLYKLARLYEELEANNEHS